ncbi:MAG: cellulase family glycosylhydrolase [Planctomycetota bacterium]|nr:cellulase family glycosylhydrolase [Planctomycetota bacterium]
MNVQGRPAQTVLPRWRGFNLTEMMSVKSDRGFLEDDFRMISDLGFDFVRLPLCYLLWLEGRADDDSFRIHQPSLEKIDRAVEWGRKYGLHVCINFHRAPGYSVNPEVTEKRSLWKDAAALESFCRHWAMFAERYRGIPSGRLSFNLVNEPPKPRPAGEEAAGRGSGMTREDYTRVVAAAAAAIREKDPDRLIIADGMSYGNDPCPELAETGAAQSCRAYLPVHISHYQASWFKGSDRWPPPVWPGAFRGGGSGEKWGRRELEAHYAIWADLASKGIGVHCGEGGAWNRTPHDVVLRWLSDVLDILKSHNIGWAMWNFRGGFGILDSGRSDVRYEEWHGHLLDRELLSLLQKY